MTELGNIMNNLDVSLSSQKNTGHRHVFSVTRSKNSLVPLNSSEGAQTPVTPCINIYCSCCWIQ